LPSDSRLSLLRLLLVVDLSLSSSLSLSLPDPDPELEDPEEEEPDDDPEEEEEDEERELAFAAALAFAALFSSFIARIPAAVPSLHAPALVPRNRVGETERAHLGMSSIRAGSRSKSLARSFGFSRIWVRVGRGLYSLHSERSEGISFHSRLALVYSCGRDSPLSFTFVRKVTHSHAFPADSGER
jgi:hypothetical protein